MTRQAADQHPELRLAIPPTGLREDSSQQGLRLEAAASHRLSGARLAQPPKPTSISKGRRVSLEFYHCQSKVKLRLREVKSLLVCEYQRVQLGVGAPHNLESPRGIA